MAKNEIFRYSEHITLPVPTGTKAGDPIKVGAIVGVAQTDRDADGTATVWRNGEHEFTVDNAVTTVGTALYVAGDGTSRITSLTTTATGNTLFGYAHGTKAAAAGPLPVFLAKV